MASNATPASNLLAPAAIHSSSVRAGLAFSGEADPPKERSPRRLLNALGDDCGSAALYLRPLRSICHRLRRSRSTHGVHLERSPRRDDPPKNKELASCLASSRLLLLTFNLFTSHQGRGNGVGRGRGVGVCLGVGLGGIVGVALGVGVTVGVGVGLTCGQSNISVKFVGTPVLS